MTKQLLATILLMLVLPGAALCQQRTIEQRLAAALESARKGDQKPVAALKKDPELVKGLPYLRRFVSDPNNLVKSSVFALVSEVHTPEAVGILTGLMKEGGGTWGEASVRAFYSGFDCKDLADGGGTRLRDNLIEFLGNKKSFSIAKGILLLSCFKDDAEAVRFLASPRSIERKTIALDPTSSVDVSAGVDLALAEMGQPAAVKKVVDRLNKGEISDLLFAMTAIRFINRRQVLAALAERISDKRKAFYPWSDDFYLRVCDLAVNALAQKTGMPVDIKIRTNYRYSEDELKRAELLLKPYFKTG